MWPTYIYFRHIFHRFPKSFICSSSSRTLFCFNQSLDAELTTDVKKEIEEYWKDIVNIPYPTKKDAAKFYLLSMFPYPSGNLHMGHVRVYTISDAVARFLRMNGRKVIHPIGWDAFGLPAENAAIEHKIHPFEWTKNNIQTMKNQLQEFNISFDWKKELATCDPNYYKWTQYLFLLMYKHGLAYKKQALVNWDPVDQTVLAEEQVDENGCSWRSGCKVEKRRLSQWFLRTSLFSKELYSGLSDSVLVEWREAMKIQKNWIGEPDGYIFHFDVCHKNSTLKSALTVWTDTPELIFGAAFVGISPNHHFNLPQYGDKTDSEDDHLLDITVKHPFSGNYLPVFVSNSLKHSPATDSCLGIPVVEKPSHLSFVRKFNIHFTEVLSENSDCLINSEEFSGMSRNLAKEAIINKAKVNGIKAYQASNKLRDWLISRQRYWGTPIPIVNCPSCQIVPVQEEDLPVCLPSVSDFDGKVSSLKGAEEWINVKCPKCGGPATRETDTMDTFVDSSWYFLRYLDVENQSEPYNVNKINDLMPVDLYIGGKEHAALHLFYARFLGHFLHSVGMLKHPEPFTQLLMQGMVMGKSYRLQSSGKYITREEVDFSKKVPVEMATQSPVIEDWEKMSKSKYNGIDPKKIIEEYGIDTTRLFILGNIAPESPRKWNDELFPGIQNWQWRLWLTVADFVETRKTSKLHDSLKPDEISDFETELRDSKNYYIKGVTHNYIHTRQLSVVISKLQGLTGSLRRIPKVVAETDAYEEALAVLLIMLAPLAPHFSCELWTAFISAASKKSSIYDSSLSILHQKWPEIDDTCPMQINIKLNGEDCDVIRFKRADFLKLSTEEAIRLATSRQKVLDGLEGAKIRYTRYKQWHNFDSEVSIVFKPLAKKARKQKIGKLDQSS